MKVYNKKGLAWGIFWTALGLFSPVSYTHLDVYKRQKKK